MVIILVKQTVDFRIALMLNMYIVRALCLEVGFVPKERT